MKFCDLVACLWLATILLLINPELQYPACAAEPPVATRKYAVDREVQVLHLKLDVIPDFKMREVTGHADIRFKPIYKPLKELKLDAKDLRISRVKATKPVQSFQSTGEQLIVTFKDTIPADTDVTVSVDYEAEPKEGLYFRTPEMGYREGETHLFTQGEEIMARHWYPCVDAPNALFTSEIICRVPEGMTVISNGRLVSEAVDAASGLRVFHWAQEKPHANYLITLIAGYFQKLEDKYGEIPLALFTPPSDIQQAESSFRNTKDMMEFFEKETGVAYPWPKYYQVCVNDFVAGGMENTSATTLTDGTLFSTESENIHDSDGLIAHELAHQWFGDLVTCKDWSHIWLNEGFATYYETLYQGHKGRDEMLFDLYRQAKTILGQNADLRAIVRRTYEEPREMFGYLSYQKGGWVVHMLREELGPDTFKKCIQTYLERHRHGNVVTEDLRRIVEEFTGRSFDRFFDQWVYHAGFPNLQVSYSWDETRRLAHMNIRQTQKAGPEALLFQFPLKMRFKCEDGIVDREVSVTQGEEDFYFPLPGAPLLVRVDPEYALLADVSFPVSEAMLKVQVQEQSDQIGRILAVNEYAKKANQEAVARLGDVLKNDPFYGVRQQASVALGGMKTEEAFSVLLDCTVQEDARVRRQVVQDIGRFYRAEARDFALKLLESEKNPDIRIAALGSLAAYGDQEVKTALLRHLKTDSYRNRVSEAAIRAMRDQADPAFVAPIIETLRTNEKQFTRRGFGQGLSALASLAHHEENTDEVRDFLLAQLQDLRKPVRLAAINALGKLGDLKAAAALEKIASGSKETQEASAAETALTEVRKESRPSEELSSVRKEILDLQKANRELKGQLEELKKQFDTIGTGPALAEEKKSSVKGRKSKRSEATSTRG